MKWHCPGACLVLALPAGLRLRRGQPWPWQPLGRALGWGQARQGTAPAGLLGGRALWSRARLALVPYRQGGTPHGPGSDLAICRDKQFEPSHYFRASHNICQGKIPSKFQISFLVKRSLKCTLICHKIFTIIFTALLKIFYKNMLC